MSGPSVFQQGYLAVSGVSIETTPRTTSPRELIKYVIVRGRDVKEHIRTGWVHGLEWCLDNQRMTVVVDQRQSLLPSYTLEPSRAPSKHPLGEVRVVHGFDPVHVSPFVALIGTDQHLYYQYPPKQSTDNQWTAWVDFRRLQMPSLTAHTGRVLTWRDVADGRLWSRPSNSSVYLLSDLVRGDLCYLFAHPTGYYLVSESYAEPIPPPSDPKFAQPLLPMLMVVYRFDRCLPLESHTTDGCQPDGCQPDGCQQGCGRILLANDCYLFGETKLLDQDYSERHQALVDAVYNSQSYLYEAGWRLHYQTQSPFDTFERLAEVVKEHIHRQFPYEVVGFSFRSSGPVDLRDRYVHQFTDTVDFGGMWLLDRTTNEVATAELAGESPHRFLQKILTDALVPNDDNAVIFDEPVMNTDLDTERTIRVATVHGGSWLQNVRAKLKPGQQMYLLTLNLNALNNLVHNLDLHYGPYHLHQVDKRWYLNDVEVQPINPFELPDYKVVQWQTSLPYNNVPQVVAQFARFWCIVVVERS